MTLTIIKGKEEKKVTVDAAPIDMKGWHLLCHLDRPGFVKLSLYFRGRGAERRYCLLSVDVSLDQEAALRQYTYMIEELGAVADVKM